MNPAFLKFSKFAFTISCTLLVGGCGSETEQPSKPASTSTPSAYTNSTVTAPVDYLAATMKAGQQVKGKVETIAIEKAIESFQQEEGRFPSSLDELVTKGSLKTMPSPPVGMQFEYDPQAGTIKLVPKQ